ncbi:PCC domain-containing protein [Jatrophihabitans sp. DSM 45814]
MPKVVSGDIERVIYARFDAGADLLLSLREVIKSENITTGLILDLTGALNVARLQHFKELGDPESKVSVVEIPGPMEASGGGIIGRCVGTGGVGGYVDGEPYVHCHLTVNSSVHTFMGHLMEGTIIRAPHYGRGNTKSHFTVVLGQVRGVDLQMVSGGPGSENNGLGTWTPEHGYVYHELEAR